MGFNTQQNSNDDRNITIQADTTAYLNLIPNESSGFKFAEFFTASVKSDREVTFWFEWGRGAYDFQGGISTCPADDTWSQKCDCVGAPNQIRLAIHNPIGGVANITRDVGVFG